MRADKTTRGNVRRVRILNSYLQNPSIVNNVRLFVRINERLSALYSKKYNRAGQSFQLAQISL